MSHLASIVRIVRYLWDLISAGLDGAFGKRPQKFLGGLLLMALAASLQWHSIQTFIMGQIEASLRHEIQPMVHELHQQLQHAKQESERLSRSRYRR